MKLTSTLNQTVVLVIATVFVMADANACFAPSDKSTSSPAMLVRMANYVVLAEAKSALGGGGSVGTEFVFETKEVLKGDAPKQFKFYGTQRGPADHSSADFDGHTDPVFWAYSTVGNSRLTTWCGVLGIFEIGETYLIINSKEGHFKGYENIKSEEDLWLKVVMLLVEDHPERPKANEE